MLIILEGVDGAGKSTLAERLVTELERRKQNRVLVAHAEPPHHDATPWGEYVEPLLNYRPGRGEHIICDRWHLGEMAYPDAGKRPLSMYEKYPGSFHWVDAFLRSRGAIVVHVDRLDEDILEYLAAAPENTHDAWTRDHLNVLKIRYNIALYAWSTLATLHDDEAFDVERVINFARRQELLYTDLNNFVTYTGPRYPSVVLFGDVRNDNTDDRVPAFRPNPGTSGAWLYNTLGRWRSHNEWWRTVGVANACDVDDPTTLIKTLTCSSSVNSRTFRPAVVALGSRAHDILQAAYVDHGAVTHPQYAHRFHNHYREWYARVLQTAYTQRTDERTARPDDYDKDAEWLTST